MSGQFMMKCVLGMECGQFIIIAADKTNTQSIIIMDQDEDKILEVSDRLLMGVIGEAGDVTQLTQFLSSNLQLYHLRNGYQLGTNAVVHFTRKMLADGLRSGKPIILNSLIGGFDENGANLYTMDFLASCVKVLYAVQGTGGYLCLSILQNCYRPNLTLTQAYEVMETCVRELHRRFIVNLPTFSVKAITRDGVMRMPDITPAQPALLA